MKIRLNYIPADVMALPLEEITPRLLMDRILRPLEHAEKLETARRVRILISQMFRYGIALGEVYSDPARDLQAALKTPVRESFAAATMPEDLKKIWQAVCGYSRPRLRCALQLAALTFQRPFNIRTMEWSEIDLEKRVWTIPAAKMKMRLAKKKTAAPHMVRCRRLLWVSFRISRVSWILCTASQARGMALAPCLMRPWSSLCVPWTSPQRK